MFIDFTPAHVEHVAIWLAEIFGGPTRFTDELGGHRSRPRGLGGGHATAPVFQRAERYGVSVPGSDQRRDFVQEAGTPC
ncbi:globin family protein [Streptacidiphilus sp. PAMC 29251]